MPPGGWLTPVDSAPHRPPRSPVPFAPQVITIGGFCEILGWVGRVWSAENVYNENAFLIQEVLLILAPCFFSAAVYGSLGMMVRAVGPEHSRLRSVPSHRLATRAPTSSGVQSLTHDSYLSPSPSWYLWVFCTADLIAIVVQAVGGGSAAVALANCRSSLTGTHIMLAGIVFQLFSMVVFCLLGLDFVRRARRDPAYAGKANVVGGRVGLLVWSLGWASAWILVRCVYRTVELAQGWSGWIITHEPMFLCLDVSSSLIRCTHNRAS